MLGSSSFRLGTRVRGVLREPRYGCISPIQSEAGFPHEGEAEC